MKKDVIVIFGGSFNPPLNSHFSLAEQIVNEYEEVEKVVFIPVNSQYQKNDLIDNESRFEMVKLVCDKNPEFVVSRVEIDAPRALYTIETLDAVQKQYEGKSIWFTIGSDNLKELYIWERSEELVKNYKLLILERDQDNMEEIIQNDPFLEKHKEAFLKVKANIRSNLSSTFVRDKIRRGKSIRYLTPDEVYIYIQEHGLYKTMKNN